MGAEADNVDLQAMVLGLSHSLSRYKLKFSPDKVDTMIIQAIGMYFSFAGILSLSPTFLLVFFLASSS